MAEPTLWRIAPALKKLTVPMDCLYKDQDNFNVHPDENIEEIRRSLERFGQLKPIVVNSDGMIVAGNGTYDAALKLGAKEIAVVRVNGEYLDGSELKVFGISDNVTARTSYLDAEKVKEFMTNCLEHDPFFEIPGYTAKQLEEIVDGSKNTSSSVPDGEVSGKKGAGDEVPEDVPTRSKLGDVFRCGQHIVCCADLLNSDNLSIVLELAVTPGFSVVFADPPYGQSYQSNFKTEKFDKIANDDTYLDLKCVYGSVLDGGAIYVCTRWDHYPHWLDEANKYTDVKNCVIWHKPGGGLGDLKSAYIFNHEMIIYGVKGKHILHGKREGDVWTISKDGGTTYQHPTQKPIELAEKCIAKSSSAGDWVFEPFGGSAPGLIACERLVRKCVTADIEPKYVDVALARWEAESGLVAELITEGLGV